MTEPSLKDEQFLSTSATNTDVYEISDRKSPSPTFMSPSIMRRRTFSFRRKSAENIPKNLFVSISIK